MEDAEFFFCEGECFSRFSASLGREVDDDIAKSEPIRGSGVIEATEKGSDAGSELGEAEGFD